MKNKIAIASAAFLAASSFSTAEIVINDFLSFEGFVDMSYNHTNTEVNNNSTSSSSFQIDQVEISWLFDFDTVTAQIDLEYEDNSGNGNGGAGNANQRGEGNGNTVEQAFATYHFDDGSALTAGRYASMLGFEAFEPTGLYQYSTAYSAFANSAVFLPGYAQGVKYTHEGDSTFFGVSLQDTVGYFGGVNSLQGSGNGTGFGVEVAGAFYMDNGLSFFLGGAYDDNDFGDYYVVNTYVTFETGAWIFAFELNYADADFDGAGNADGISALLMANFAYSDQGSITGRISYFDADWGFGFDADGITYTLAHSYAFTDNLLLVTELSFTDEEAGAADMETLTGAVELIFSF